MERIETISVKEAALALGITPMKVKYAILNGTMPIGLVAREEDSSHDRTVIVKKRFEMWVNGEL